MTETRAARATDSGLVPGEKGKGSRKKGEPGQRGQTDAESRAARATGEARQARMEERSSVRGDVLLGVEGKVAGGHTSSQF